MEMKKYKLGELCRIASAKRIFEDEYVEFGIPFVRGQEVSDGSLLDENAKFHCYISNERYEELKQQYGIPVKGDILITAVGTIGNLCYLPKNIDFYFKDGNLIWFSNFHKDLYSKYLYFFMKSSIFKNQLNNTLIGAVQKALTMDKLSKIEIELPALPEQQKITAVLSSLDDKIALNNRINTKLEQMAKRLYDYWFVQFDFPGADGKPYKSSDGKMVWNEELKREIPDGWEVVKFKDVITHINTGLNPRDNFSLGNGNIKYITVKNLTEKGEIDFSNCDLIDEAARELVHNRSEIEKGDILLASICPLGRCYLLTSEPESWDINESVFSIRPNYSNVTSVFLYAVLRDPYYVKKMTQKATGSIFKGIRIDDIEKIELVLPVKNIIDLYTEKVKSIINKQALLQEENMKLTAMRDKLLPLLMNGQVCIK